MLNRRNVGILPGGAAVVMPNKADLLLQFFKNDPFLLPDFRQLMGNAPLSADNLKLFAERRYPALPADEALRRAFIAYSISLMLDARSKNSLSEDAKVDVVFAEFNKARRNKLNNPRLPDFVEEADVYDYIDLFNGPGSLTTEELEQVYARITTGLKNQLDSNTTQVVSYLTAGRQAPDTTSTVSGLLNGLSTLYKDNLEQHAEKSYADANADPTNIEKFGRTLESRDFLYYKRHETLIKDSLKKLLEIVPSADSDDPDQRDLPDKGKRLYEMFNAGFREILVKYNAENTPQEKLQLEKDMQRALGRLTRILRENNMAAQADLIVAQVFPNRVNRIEKQRKLVKGDMQLLSIATANKLFAKIKQYANTSVVKLLGQDVVPLDAEAHINANPGLEAVVNEFITKAERTADLDSSEDAYEPKRRLINRWLKLQEDLQSLAIDEATNLPGVNEGILASDDARRLGIASTQTMFEKFKRDHDKLVERANVNVDGSKSYLSDAALAANRKNRLTDIKLKLVPMNTADINQDILELQAELAALAADANGRAQERILNQNITARRRLLGQIATLTAHVDDSVQRIDFGVPEDQQIHALQEANRQFNQCNEAFERVKTLRARRQQPVIS